MKKLTVLETSIIGMLVGVVAASYIAYATGTDGFLGESLKAVSLLPVLDRLNPELARDLAASFGFVVAVYTAYGALVGIASKMFPKAGIAALVALLLVTTGASAEQILGGKRHAVAANKGYEQVAAVALATPKAPKQYFGMEALGDLDGDGSTDVAFLIPRPDDDGTIYYLSSALTVPEGKRGTNLMFLGANAKPVSISITDKVISVQYEKTEGLATSSAEFRAEVVDGTLVEAKAL